MLALKWLLLSMNPWKSIKDPLRSTDSFFDNDRRDANWKACSLLSNFVSRSNQKHFLVLNKNNNSSGGSDAPSCRVVVFVQENKAADWSQPQQEEEERMEGEREREGRKEKEVEEGEKLERGRENWSKVEGESWCKERSDKGMKRRLPSKKKSLYLESFPVPRDRRPVLCQPLFSPALRRKKEVLAAPELVLAQRDRLKNRYNTREMFCKCFQHLSCRNKEH